MIRTRASRIIECPLAEVFAYMTDLAKLPQWLEGVREARHVSGDPNTVGSRVAHVNEFMGQTFESTFEVIRWEENRSLVFKVLSGPLRGESYETFTALGGSRTEVEIRVEGAVVAAFAGASWLAGRYAQRQLDKSLDNVKRLLENAARNDEVSR